MPAVPLLLYVKTVPGFGAEWDPAPAEFFEGKSFQRKLITMKGRWIPTKEAFWVLRNGLFFDEFKNAPVGSLSAA